MLCTGSFPTDLIKDGRFLTAPSPRDPFESASLSPSSSPTRRSFLSKVVDEGRFLRQWAENPLGIGAIAPSGEELASGLAGALDPLVDGPVVELGPGTGVVTSAILERGYAPDRLTSIEYCDRFAGLLETRFPDIRVVRGDAYAMADLVSGDAPLSGVVSGLPLFTSPYDKRRALILDALDLLLPGAPFVQFSYALVPPVRPEPGHFTVTKSGWIWNNMPPARIWVYRKVH